MSTTGLLVLTSSLGQLAPQLQQLLTSAARCVSGRLYVQLLPGQQSLAAAAALPAYRPLLYWDVVCRLYAESARACPQLDVRVLLSHLKRRQLRAQTAAAVDVLLLERPCAGAEQFAAGQVSRRGHHLQTIALQTGEPLTAETAGLCAAPDELPDRWLGAQAEPDNALAVDAVYDKVALGGTFDGIHNGHKVLLTAGLMRCRQELTVGVTDGQMNNKKTLKELMAPCLERVQLVTDLLADLDCTVRPRVVPITDPLGPTATEADLQLLVVSEETRRGAQMVADERRRRQLPPMDVYTVPLLAAPDRQAAEEPKISSSTLRMRRLGTARRPRLGVPRRAGGPYVIGLTGSAASGKSSVARRLAGLGAHVIDCDKLGHAAYAPDTPCHAQLRQLFGEDIVAADGRIDRQRLGAHVFGDPAALRRLTDCVWPEIARLAERRLAALGAGQVAVLDAAVLLEAGWDAQLCDEVWVALVPRDEALRRAVRRDGISEQAAARRLDAQMSNEERVAAATVVISTLWEPEVTQQQVERAWSQLRADLGHDLEHLDDGA
ncbi:Bifunctional coenzyme A synthase [Amphibalanus amphitrite]|uniref:Bifunctional coenzyme A synthase n=1 Tax=Amphibalanus amphitrite TaxID=1232801 RepID=A0A6A4X7G6_AMPAM|nr:Bifunctional coenzyme A synthase [Amphibalanus amphitrite]